MVNRMQIEELSKLICQIRRDAAQLGAPYLPNPPIPPELLEEARSLVEQLRRTGTSRRSLLIKLVVMLGPVSVAQLVEVLRAAGDDVGAASVHATCSNLVSRLEICRSDDNLLVASG